MIIFLYKQKTLNVKIYKKYTKDVYQTWFFFVFTVYIQNFYLNLVG